MDVRQFFARLAKADFADAIGAAVSDNHVSVAHLRKRVNNVEVLDFRTRDIDAPPEGVWPLIADFVRDFAGGKRFTLTRDSFNCPKAAPIAAASRQVGVRPEGNIPCGASDARSTSPSAASSSMIISATSSARSGSKVSSSRRRRSLRPSIAGSKRTDETSMPSLTTVIDSRSSSL